MPSLTASLGLGALAALCLLAVHAPSAAQGARVLAVVPIKSHSHFAAVWPLLRSLCERGHEVDVATRMALPEARPASCRHVPVSSDSSPVPLNGFNLQFVADVMSGALPNALGLMGMGLKDCESVLGDASIQALARARREGAPRYDLVITELFHTDCFVALAHVLQAPFMSVSTCPLLDWGYARFGNPLNPAHMPSALLHYSDEMDFAARLDNALFQWTLRIAHALYFQPREQRIVAAHLGDDVPHLKDLTKNTSLLLVNAFNALSLPRAFLPNVVEVGGIHIQPSKALPEDLEQFVSGAKDGVILFSLGSMIRASSLPQESAAGLLRGFGTLKQRVVWKWEDAAPGPVPKNVRLAKWLPQYDVLCHNNTRLFIGHGGMLSTSEAAHCGVPLLGVAMYGDQRTNLAAVSKAGAGRGVSYSTLKDADAFLVHVKELLNDPSYLQNAKLLSARFRDRPMSPLDTAVYWTEYVIRHKGAPHLRGAARHLAWYQEALLDVLAVALAGLGVAVLALWLAARALLRLAARLVARLAGRGDAKQADKKKKQ